MILYFASPLLDIIAKVDQEFLNKYCLKSDNAVRATSEMDGLFKEILKYNPIIQPGGSVTNSARVFQWASKKSYPITVLGCIGKDNFGKIIKDKLVEEEINCHLVEVEGVSTGICAVLLTGENRSLVTHLGASKFFTVKDLDEKVWKDILQAKYFYVSAFLISVSFEVIKTLVTHFVEQKKQIIFNLAANFLCDKYPKEMSYIFENADMVFGNETEYSSFAKSFKILHENVKDLLRNTNRSFSNKPNRWLIMTRGPKSLFILHSDNLEEFEAPHLHEDRVLDTNGAGDAFVGGFLARFVKNKSIEDCVKCGTWASAEVIQNHGCNFDNKKVYQLLGFIYYLCFTKKN